MTTSIKKQGRYPLTWLEDALERKPSTRHTYEHSVLRSGEIATLDQALRHEDIQVRRTAIWFLGFLGDKRAATTLILILRSDNDIDCRGTAADALGFLKSRRGIAPLLDALQNAPQVEVRERAASGLRWLWRIKDERIINGLIAAMANKDEDPFVREMVADAIGSYDSHKAAPVLVEALDDPSPNVRYWSAAALSISRYEPALAKLERLACEDTAICYEPNTNSLVNGSVCACAAWATIKTKRDLDIPLTKEELKYSTPLED